MVDYVKTTDFDAKDTNNDFVLGADFTLEFDAVANASSTKGNKVGSPVLDNIIAQTNTGDAKNSGLKTAKTPQTDATVTFEQDVVFNTVTDIGTGTNFTATWGNGNKQKVTMSGNGTATFAAPGGPCNLVLLVTNSGAARTITWPGSVKWPSSSVPTPSGSGKRDLYSFFYDGTTYFGTGIGDY